MSISSGPNIVEQEYVTSQSAGETVNGTRSKRAIPE